MVNAHGAQLGISKRGNYDAANITNRGPKFERISRKTFVTFLNTKCRNCIANLCFVYGTKIKLRVVWGQGLQALAIFTISSQRTEVQRRLLFKYF